LKKNILPEGSYPRSDGFRNIAKADFSEAMPLKPGDWLNKRTDAANKTHKYSFFI
jgi:hypothetical protein